MKIPASVAYRRLMREMNRLEQKRRQEEAQARSERAKAPSAAR